MTLRHIEIFVAICHEGSITQAAERLHISQPTVSIALRELEEHYGVKLFDRLSHKLHITPFGESVYERSRRLMDLWDDLSHESQTPNRIRIGTGTAIGKLLLPVVVKGFVEKHPDAHVNICVGDAPRMYRLALENTLDFVIAETVAKLPGLSSRALQHYPVVAVCHRDNPLARKELVTAADLAQQNLLLREPSSLTRQVVDLYFQRHNMYLTPMWVSYSVQTLLNAARENLGVSFLSLDHVLVSQIPELVILNIPDFHGERYVNLCYHKDKFFTPLMEAFIQDYVATVQQLLGRSIRAYQRIHPDSSYPFPPVQFS